VKSAVIREVSAEDTELMTRGRVQVVDPMTRFHSSCSCVWTGCWRAKELSAGVQLDIYVESDRDRERERVAALRYGNWLVARNLMRARLQSSLPLSYSILCCDGVIKRHCWMCRRPFTRQQLTPATYTVGTARLHCSVWLSAPLCSTKAYITIAIRLRYDYDTTRTKNWRVNF